MALGFIVAGVTTRKIVPDKTLTKNSTPRLRIQRFGDGYEQRVVDGINNINQTYSRLKLYIYNYKRNKRL